MSLTREEFETVLKDLFYNLAFPTNIRTFQQCIVTNSKTMMNVFATNYLNAQERISFYLDAWDNAVGQPAKDVVVGTVVSDLGNLSVDPEDAYLWLATEGHFGDVRSTFSAIVDGTTIGNTSIFTCPAGKRFIPEIVSITLLDILGLSIVSTCSIGTNASFYNNIMPATVLTGLSGQNSRFGVFLTGISSTVAPLQQVFCRVSVADTATTYNINVSVSGFLIVV